ncbi:hypothetical protein KCM76_18325 [Zooshikella marina]|uniref:hypothetical protein n=1 Tax=Zooshikella ganghwensis TaxID=202772 RepID=UPI001BB02ABC|nr:hypothetical protein [Zooshikella ganghwensis]MBU2707958.1 hypothetical protein [Zooshikella ganghwensis]
MRNIKNKIYRLPKIEGSSLKAGDFTYYFFKSHIKINSPALENPQCIDWSEIKAAKLDKGGSLLLSFKEAPDVLIDSCSVLYALTMSALMTEQRRVKDYQSIFKIHKHSTLLASIKLFFILLSIPFAFYVAYQLDSKESFLYSVTLFLIPVSTIILTNILFNKIFKSTIIFNSRNIKINTRFNPVTTKIHPTNISQIVIDLGLRHSKQKLTGYINIYTSPTIKLYTQQGKKISFQAVNQDFLKLITALKLFIPANTNFKIYPKVSS